MELQQQEKEAINSIVWKVKGTEVPGFKSKGNERNYRHAEQVEAVFNEAGELLQQNKDVLNEGKKLIERRKREILLVNKHC